MGYSTRSRIAALSGMGAMAVVAVMMLAPTAGAVTAGTVIVAPWHGAMAPNNNFYTNGCGKVKIAKLWTFHMKTGLGGGLNTGSAQACASSVNGVGSYGDASVGGGFEVALPLKIPSATTSVAANLAYHIAASISAKDGYLANATPACTAPLNSYYDSYAYYDWNATLSPYGYYYYTYYNDSYSYSSSSGYSYNYSYGNAATPSPFNLNNTSYEDVGYSYGGYSSCSASASLSFSLGGTLLDTTNTTTMSQTGNTISTCYSFFGFSYCVPIFEVYVSVTNSTDWYCSAYTYWDGPYNTSGGSPLTCYSYNTTLTSYVTSYYPTYNTTTGTSNSVSWTAPTSGAGTMWWNDTFVGSHKYVLEITASQYASAYDSWKHGQGKWTWNSATLGNGVKLSSVSIT